MKYVIALLTVVTLASCWAKNAENTTSTGVTATWTTANQTVNSEINNQLDNISSSTWQVQDSKVVKLDANYDNRQTNVDMTIEYELDSEGKISKMDINATNFDISNFEDRAEKDAIGKTPEEASKIFYSWASLTSDAFQKAMKSQL